MSGGRIAVLGSANMDLVVTVDRAPQRGETVPGHSLHTVPGGKGANQALAAARAGGTVTFLGAVGDDEHGRRITNLLRDAGIDVSGLATVDQPTGTAHIVVDAAGDNSIVVVPGANGTVSSLTEDHRAGIEAADLLLLQLELPLAVVGAAATYARERGVRTVLTPAPAVPLPDSLLAAVDVLVPNEHEAALLTGAGAADAAARSLAAGGCDVVITLGRSGALHVSAADQPTVRRVPPFAVDAVDTTAAGDTFAGVLAVGLAEGVDWSASLRRASAAAALSVQRFGASSSMPGRAEIDAFLDAAEVGR